MSMLSTKDNMTDAEYERLVKGVKNGFYWWGKHIYAKNMSHRPRREAKPRLVEHVLMYGSEETIRNAAKHLARTKNTFEAVCAEIDIERIKKHERVWW